MDIIALEPTRVWRTYLGGEHLDRLENKNPQVTSFPEDWLASVVAASNPTRKNDYPNEGLSLLKGGEISLKDIVEKDKAAFIGSDSMGFLAKLIDSAERLTIQVHPTREIAKSIFNSDYGKTECWYIFDSAPGAVVYAGFKEGITKEKWGKYFANQDIDLMLSSLHSFEVKSGDVILIRGGLPHAIGKGCFLCELQEPTDLSIRPELTTPSGLRISDEQCHQGAGFEKMLDVFEYKGRSKEETHDDIFLSPRIVEEEKAISIEELVSYSDTPYFRMERVDVRGKSSRERNKQCSVIYILNGDGRINDVDVKAHSRFFVPAAIESLSLSGSFSFLEFYGPKKES